MTCFQGSSCSNPSRTFPKTTGHKIQTPTPQSFRFGCQVVLPTVCSLDVISFRVFYHKGLTTEPNQEQGTQHGSRAVDCGRQQQKSQTSQAKPDAQEPGRQRAKAPRQEYRPNSYQALTNKYTVPTSRECVLVTQVQCHPKPSQSKPEGK